MKLLQVMAGARHGGAEAFFVRLARALAGVQGLKQRAAVRRGERGAALRQAGVDAVAIPFGRPLWLWPRAALRREVSRFGPDVLLAWMSRAAGLAPRGRHVLVGRLGGYYKLRHFRRCDHLICNTPDLVRHVVDGGFPAEKTSYIPNFVDPPGGAACARAAHATPEDVPLLLAMGRLHQNKGFEVLLESMVLTEDAWLWLAGSGPEAAKLRALARKLGVEARVRFLPWLSDVGPLLQACDICVSSARLEPLGNVVLEAWAAGKPIIAAAATGPAHLIAHERTGLLVPVDDAQALTAGINHLCKTPTARAALAAAGRERYDRKYSERVVLQQFLQLFHKVTGECVALPA